MSKKRVTRCQNKDIHQKRGAGHILAIFDNDGIYVQCRDRGCRRWTHLEIRWPGVDVDFRDAGIVQSLMPAGHQFDVVPAATVCVREPDA
jgi:hypothetical protein